MEFMKNFLSVLLLVCFGASASLASYVSPNPYSALDLTNTAVKAEISSNQLVLTLIGKSGGAPSAANILNIGFRQSTATLGSFSTASLKTAKTVTLGTTDSLGFTSGVANTLYAYVINDSTNELCVSAAVFDESSLASATALSGGADTSGSTLYCASTHTSKPVRLIGSVVATWSNPNWGSITKVSPPYVTSLLKAASQNEIRLDTYSVGSQFATTNTSVFRYSNTYFNYGTAFTPTLSASLGASILINEDGLYCMDGVYLDDGVAAGFQIEKNTVTISAGSGLFLCGSNGQGGAARNRNIASCCAYLVTGDVIRALGSGSTDQASAAGNPNGFFHAIKMSR